MADAQYTVDIVVDDSKLKQGLSGVQNSGISAGAKGGQATGNAFAGSFGQAVRAGVGAVLSTISFNSVLSGITQSVNSYKALQKSAVGLGSTIKATNDQYKSNYAVVKDSTKSIEERALALGIDSDKIYKNVSAAKASAGANKSLKESSNALEAAIKSKKEAVDDENRITETQIKVKQGSLDSLNRESKGIQNQIQDIKNLRNEKLKALEADPAYKALITQQQNLRIQQDSLKIQVAQNKLQGNNTTLLEFQQSRLKLEQDINQGQLDGFAIQKENIKKLDSDREDSLQKQLDGISRNKEEISNQIQDLQKIVSDRKLALDVDIEPLQDKLDKVKQQISDISAASIGGGSSKVVDPAIVAQIEAAAKKNAPEIDSSAVEKSVNDVYTKFDKIVSRGTIRQAFTNLFQGGVQDVDQATKLIDRYINSASIAKSENVDLADAVVNLSDSFKTGNSAIGNLSGISENFSQIDEKGLQLFNNETGRHEKTIENLSKEDQARVRTLGTLDLTQNKQSGFTDAQKAGLLEQEKMNAELRRTKQELGEALTPAYNAVLKALLPVVQQVSEFIKNNPELVTTIAGVVLALTGLATVFFTVSAVISGLTPVFTFLGVLLGGLGAPILIIIGIIGLLALAWSTNFLGIRDVTSKVLTWVGEKFREFVNFMNGVEKNIKDALTSAKNTVGDGFRKMFDGVGAIIEDALNGAVRGFKNLLKSFIVDPINIFINAIPDPVFSSIGKNKNDFKIQGFAEGGMPSGRNVLAMLNDGKGNMAGPEMVMNAPAVTQFGPLLAAMNNIGRGSTSTTNNTTYNNYSTGSFALPNPR